MSFFRVLALVVMAAVLGAGVAYGLVGAIRPDEPASVAPVVIDPAAGTQGTRTAATQTATTTTSTARTTRTTPTHDDDRSRGRRRRLRGRAAHRGRRSRTRPRTGPRRRAMTTRARTTRRGGDERQLREWRRRRRRRRLGCWPARGSASSRGSSSCSCSPRSSRSSRSARSCGRGPANAWTTSSPARSRSSGGWSRRRGPEHGPTVRRRRAADLRRRPAAQRPVAARGDLHVSGRRALPLERRQPGRPPAPHRAARARRRAGAAPWRGRDLAHHRALRRRPRRASAALGAARSW